METSKTIKVIGMARAGVGVRVMGKMCANVFINNFMGEGLGVVFKKGLNVSTNFKPQVCYRTQFDS